MENNGSRGTRVGPAADGYRHEAFFWSGEDAFLARTVPFVLDGLDADEPVMVAVVARHLDLLRDALGDAAGSVRLVDMGDLGANPARIIPAWREFVDEHARPGRPVRGIGEPIWSGRRASELAECQLHEALLNTAIAPATPMWLMCPYDTDGLPVEVLEEARRSHPVVVDGPAGQPDRYGGDAHVARLFGTDLAPADVAVPVSGLGLGSLAALRAEVETRARAVGVSTDRAEDLALAVHEVAVNSIEHGGGHGDVRIWDDAGALVVEVRDAGVITDAMVGRELPAWDDDGGRGLWLANQLCDLVQVRSGAGGTTVRIHTWI